MKKLFKWSSWIVYVSMFSFFSFQPIDLSYATFRNYVIHKSLDYIVYRSNQYAYRLLPTNYNYRAP